MYPGGGRKEQPHRFGGRGCRFRRAPANGMCNNRSDSFLSAAICQKRHITHTHATTAIIAEHFSLAVAVAAAKRRRSAFNGNCGG